MRRIAVMTGGGDAPGMNPAIRAVVRTASAAGIEVYGIRQAYSGLLAGDFERLTSRDVSGIIQRGGTFLQTARNKEFMTTQGQKRGLRRLNEHGIEGLVVIGGDGSLRGALALHTLGFPVVGVPGSIDNDIYGTSMSIGVDTALNTILDAIDKLRDTASSHERCFLLEVMGRNSGYLATIGGIMGGAEFVIVPERTMTLEEVGQALEDAYMRGKSHAMGVIAEGATLKINEIAEYLENHEVGFEVRMTVLGHMLRGGSPSGFDRLLATRLGVAATECLLAGEFGVMVGLQGRDVGTVSLEDATTKAHIVSEEYLEMAKMLAK
ncbi:MAG: 6-phosphofructokinase [Chloroflexi bacterium]|nr:6-phosphofructokinase [Chloroflexota bacterium]